MVNAKILSAEHPFNLWGEALLTTCHGHNRVPSKKIKVFPYELWNGRKPNLNYIKVWGCLAIYRVVDPKRTKLGPRAMKSVFVGYVENSKAYRLLDLSSDTVVESRGVEFVRLILINHFVGFIPCQFACNSTFRNPVFRWETCKGSV